jgi:hypothetical protein
MPGLAMTAAITPDNTPGGYNLTFAIPLAVFAVVAIALYLMFRRPHRRVPGRRDLPSTRAAAPDPAAARAASIAGGLGVAAGGGSAESHLEPAGHTYAAGSGRGPDAEPEPPPGADAEPPPGPDPEPPPGPDPEPPGRAAPGPDHPQDAP